MPEIEFTIDESTGAMEAHIKGIPGPGCEDIQKLIEKIMGKPTTQERTPEYSVPVRPTTQIRPKG